MTAGDILESRALSFDSEKRLHFRLGEIEAITVSYTHLDVYKRQHTKRMVHRQVVLLDLERFHAWHFDADVTQ